MNKVIKLICLLALGFILTGCGKSLEEEPQKELETGFIPARAGMYDSADTAVIKRINKQEKTIRRVG